MKTSTEKFGERLLLLRGFYGPVAMPMEEQEGCRQSAVAASITTVVSIIGLSKSNSFPQTEVCFNFAWLIFVKHLIRRPFILLCV